MKTQAQELLESIRDGDTFTEKEAIAYFLKEYGDFSNAQKIAKKYDNGKKVSLGISMDSDSNGFHWIEMNFGEMIPGKGKPPKGKYPIRKDSDYDKEHAPNI